MWTGLFLTLIYCVPLAVLNYGITKQRQNFPLFPVEKTLEYSKFVSVFTFVALALPSSGRAQEENVKISQTLTTQNSSLVSTK